VAAHSGKKEIADHVEVVRDEGAKIRVELELPLLQAYTLRFKHLGLRLGMHRDCGHQCKNQLAPSDFH